MRPRENGPLADDSTAAAIDRRAVPNGVMVAVALVLLAVAVLAVVSAL